MPQTIEIGKGIVNIEIDTKKGTLSLKEMEENAKKSLQKMEDKAKETAENSTNRFQEMGGKISQLYSAVMTSAVVVFAYRTLKSLDEMTEKMRAYGDEIAKTAKKLALSTDEFQQWKYVATLSGVSMESFSVAIRRVSDLLDSARNGSEEAVKIFQRLGISIYDTSGNIKSASDIIKEVADVVREMTNQTDKVSVAVNLFGRSGTELLPILQNGSAGIQNMMEQANKLGLVIDKNTLKAIEKMKDESEVLAQKLNAIKAETFGANISLSDMAKIIEIELIKAYKSLSEIQTSIFEILIEKHPVFRAISYALDNWITKSKEIENKEKHIKKWSDLIRETKEKGHSNEVAILKNISDQEEEIKKKKKEQLEFAEQLRKTYYEDKSAINEIIKYWVDIEFAINNVNNDYGKIIGDEAEIDKKIKDIINKHSDWRTAIEEVKKIWDSIKDKKLTIEYEYKLIEEAITARTNLAENIQNEIDNATDNLEINIHPETIKIPELSEEEKAKLMDYYAKLGQEAALKFADNMSAMSSAVGELGYAFAEMANAGMINQKQAFKFQKMILIMQMMMDGMAGIARAFAQGGWVGFAIGVATFAKILTYIAKIKAMEPPEAPKAKYPKMAEGGIVMQRQIVEVAEEGKPEAILPLDKLGKIIQQKNEVIVKLDVSDKSSFLRGLTAEIERVKRRDYV